MATTPSPPSLDPLVIAGEAEAAAENVVLPHAEEARVLVRPNTIGHLWVEDEYDELETEQQHLWDATGTSASRDTAVQAARTKLAADEVNSIVTEHRRIVADALERRLCANQVLTPFRRRAKASKLWYQAGKAGLLCSDVVGFGTAAIWLGELPAIALTLAAGAAVATVAAGLLGVDVRDREQRRQRQAAVPEPSDEQKNFPHLFLEPVGGALKRMLLVAAGTAGMIGIGIAALRSAVDDPFVGIVFGGIALAVAGGSFLLSYAGADEVADLIEHAEADYARAVAEHAQYSQHDTIQIHAAATTAEGSILTEHAERGDAAARRVSALKWGILRRNPSHAGHGAAPGRPAAISGQMPRREAVNG
ncbi:hypothetical protein RL72_01576 [Microbacterium azadirachtae]|uniref:Uncharacterized protein n=1 Tax=Microbacterium azadirachtae TaxID=582680 RepID=A0A0F0KVF3_9MICO|nr:hypothetical protein [Microbacterium azadirachtae]KJL24853.1 hypothetical protein RL72_01576 [Microbacterium azadirachtae]